MRSIEIPQPAERDWRYRSLEILPLILSVLVLSAPFILGLISPQIAAFFVIAYLLTWFSYVTGVNLRALKGWRLMSEHRKLAWDKLNAELEDLSVKSTSLPKWHYQNLARVERDMGEDRIKPSQVYHAVIIPFWNESREILEPTIKTVLSAHYDSKKMIFFLAYESRGGQEVEERANALVDEYKSRFFYAEAVKHIDQPGEVVGKGGNATNAGRALAKFVKQAGIDPLKVIVTTLDSDNRPDTNYFGALTYTYCSTEEPLYASYQPIPLFLNNIWDAPAPMRVIATGNSYWNIMLSTRPHMLRNFSSHAQPLAALIDTDFWSVRTVVEDGHHFWRTYFRYDSKHDVFPIHLPIYQDAVLSDSYKKTLKSQFLQVRRWAYGASDIAYVFNQAFLKKNNIPRHKSFAKLFRLTMGHVSWASMPLILLSAGYPALFLHPESYTANQLSRFSSNLQFLAMFFVLSSLFISFKSLPPKPERYKRHRSLWMLLQWAYLPFVTVIYGSFAALNSQVRLAFGWYLDKFDLTEKAVKGQRSEVTEYLKK